MRYTCPAGSSRWKITSLRWKCFDRIRAASSRRSRCPRGAKTGECESTSAIWLASTTANRARSVKCPLRGYPDDLLDARPNVLRQSLHALRVVGVRETRDPSAQADLPVRLQVLLDLIGVPDEDVGAIHARLVLRDVREHALRLVLVVADHEPAPAVGNDLVRIAADIGAVPSHDLESVLDEFGGPEAVPQDGVASCRPERPLL